MVEEKGLVVGFDLDLTLIDTSPGFSATLDALAAELGVTFPSAELASALGPPLDQILAPYLPESDLAAATDRFRALYPDHAVTSTPHLTGAHTIFGKVSDDASRAVVDAIATTPVDRRDRPLEDVKITGVTITED